MKRFAAALSGLVIATTVLAGGCAWAFQGYGHGYGHAAGHGPSNTPRMPPTSAPRGYAPRSGAPGYGAPGYGPRGYAPAPSAYPGGGARGPNSLGAGWREQQDEARMGVRRGQFASLGRVIEGIRARAPGRQLATGIEYRDGRAVYRVRWMTVGGRRMDYIVDAATGAILNGR